MSRLRSALRDSRDWLVAGRDYATALWTRARRRLPVPVRGEKACQDIPVLVVPGILEPWTSMLPMSRALTQQGHDVHVVERLGFNLAPLDVSVTRCLKVLDDEDLHDVVLLAHSKGGLIGKSLMVHPGSADRIAGMVTIATPFAGSSVGRSLHRFRLFARSPLGLFDPRGSELARLAAEAAVNARIVSLCPAWDQMVPEGSELPGATNISLAVGGHFRPLTDNHTIELVHQHLHRLAEPAPDKE